MKTRELRNALKTVRGIIGIENLKAMKKDGATMGALSENELELLTNIEGPLDITRPEQTIETLNKIIRKYNDLLVTAHTDYQEQFGGGRPQRPGLAQ